LSDIDYPLSVLAVGSADGAPIPLPGGGFARDNSGNIIVPSLTVSELQELAAAGKGKYRELSLDDSDINALALDTASSLKNSETEDRSERHYDQWKDAGPWLVLLLLPFALLGFRKSWLPSLLPLLLPALFAFQPSTANAFEFKDLWQTPDQQAAALLPTDPQAAAAKFEDPMWKAAAQYRAGDFAAAAESYQQFDSADADYNRGNALAKANKLDEAIAAYESALQKDPTLSDARKNKKILEDAKKSQEQQQQSGDDKQNQSGDQNQQNQDSQNNESQSEQSQDQQSQDQQSQNQSEQSQQEDSQNQEQSDSQENQNADQDSSQSEGNQQKEANEGESEQGDTEPESEQTQAEKEAAEQRDAKLAEDYARQAAEQNEAMQKAMQENQDAKQAAALAPSDEPLSEEDQAREQWLRKIPDNPGNLLRNKFRYQHQQRSEQQGTNEDYAPY
ncbi:MAG: Ca-activated chloride channel family protein, partial [Zhongshania marina]